MYGKKHRIPFTMGRKLLVTSVFSLCLFWSGQIEIIRQAHLLTPSSSLWSSSPCGARPQAEATRTTTTLLRKKATEQGGTHLPDSTWERLGPQGQQAWLALDPSVRKIILQSHPSDDSNTATNTENKSIVADTEKHGVTPVQKASIVEEKKKDGITPQVVARSSNDTVPCRPVFFIGGGKSGSTMMASWLKHSPESKYLEYHAASGFLDAEKEICFGRQKRKMRDPETKFLNYFHPRPDNLQHCPADRPYLLDGCPLWRDAWSFKDLEAMTNHQARYIMLARDPVDQRVSFLNGEQKPPRPIPDIDSQVQIAKHQHLSNRFGALLEEALSVLPADRILVVLNEMMNHEPQAVMDDVYDFLGHDRVPINVDTQVRANCAQCVNKYYSEPSEQARQKAQQIFRPDVEKFMKAIGTNYLPWKTAEPLLQDPPKRPTNIAIAGYDAFVRRHGKNTTFAS